MEREQRREKMAEEMIEKALWRMSCFEALDGQNGACRHLF